MIVSQKITTINNKIEQNRFHYNLDKKTAKISALSSGYVGKYNFFTGEYVLPEKLLLEKLLQLKALSVHY